MMNVALVKLVETEAVLTLVLMIILVVQMQNVLSTITELFVNALLDLLEMPTADVFLVRLALN